jgi:DNA-binding transcriptional regulator LsrR (DeoR family)
MADNNELLSRIAYLYYKNDLTQQQIANQIGLSRSKVVRLLQEAKRTGIVRIEIVKKLPLQEEVAFDLQRLFKLQRAIVVRTEESQAHTLESIRSAVANLIIDELRNVKNIGFGYSRTLGNIADYIHADSDTYDVAVCDLMGAMIGFSLPYGPAADVARRIGGTFYPISAPIMALEGSEAEVYLADPNLKRSMQAAGEIQLAVVGIGDSSTQNILYRSGYITEETVNNMRRQGIVGEICMHFFNANGMRVESEIESRIISVPWNSLKRAKIITAVFSESHKVLPTLAALKTGVISILVTDDRTAKKILELHQQTDLTDN